MKGVKNRERFDEGTDYNAESVRQIITNKENLIVLSSGKVRSKQNEKVVAKETLTFQTHSGNISLMFKLQKNRVTAKEEVVENDAYLRNLNQTKIMEEHKRGPCRRKTRQTKSKTQVKTKTNLNAW